MLCTILIQFIESRPTKTAFSKIRKDIIFILMKPFFSFSLPIYISILRKLKLATPYTRFLMYFEFHRAH